MYHSMQRVVSPRTRSEKKGENVRRDEKEEEETRFLDGHRKMSADCVLYRMWFTQAQVLL